MPRLIMGRLKRAQPGRPAMNLLPKAGGLFAKQQMPKPIGLIPMIEKKKAMNMLKRGMQGKRY
jgi:hypothetical protein